MSAQTNDTGNRWQKRRARVALASGIGLGIGALAGVAAWNDSLFSIGGSGGTSVHLDGSLDGEYFTPHDESGQAVELDFAALQMEPQETVYAPFSIRLSADTEHEAIVDAGSGLNIARSDGEYVPKMTFDVFQGLKSCNADGARGADPIGAGSTLAQGNVPLTEDIDLTPGDGEEAGQPVNLCFAITGGSQVQPVEGEQAEVTWRIQAISNES